MGLAQQMETPSNVQEFIKTYVALLVNFGDETIALPKKIHSNSIPADLQDAKTVLRAVERCVADGHPPKRHFIEAEIMKQGWHADTKFLDSVPEVWASTPKESIRFLNSFIHQHLFETSVVDIWTQAAAIMADVTSAPFADRYQKVSQLVATTSPNIEELKIITDNILYTDSVKEYERKRQILLTEGKFPYPTPFLLTLREMGVMYMDGEASLLLGAEGTGKSSFAQQIAEYVAWQQGIGYDVLYLSLETSIEILAYRSLSRNCGIPFDEWMKFKVDTRSQEYLTVYNAFLQKRMDAEEKSGYVHYAMPAIPSADAIIDAVHTAYLTSQAAGRKLFVIVDHIGRLEKDRSSNANDANIITGNVLRIMNTCKALNIHVKFVGHADNSGNGKLFNATEVNKLVQFVEVLESDFKKDGVDNDMPATDWTGEKKLADYRGRPRWFHRVGNSHPGIIKYRIQKANNLSTGSVNLYVERPMGNNFLDMREEYEKVKRMNS